MRGEEKFVLDKDVDPFTVGANESVGAAVSVAVSFVSTFVICSPLVVDICDGVMKGEGSIESIGAGAGRRRGSNYCSEEMNAYEIRLRFVESERQMMLLMERCDRTE